MIDSLEQIQKYPIVLLVYYAGSSGEFLAHALNQSLDQMCNTSSQWENSSRVKFADAFGRSFNGSNTVPTTDVIIKRFNQQLENYDSGTMIGLAHPSLEIMNFLKCHFADFPVIEITSTNMSSKIFRCLARQKKIEVAQPRYQSLRHEISCLPVSSGIDFLKHLRIEWSDIFLDRTAEQFQKIEKFLNTTGNLDLFVNMVKEYCDRNQDLISQINENQLS